MNHQNVIHDAVRLKMEGGLLISVDFDISAFRSKVLIDAGWLKIRMVFDSKTGILISPSVTQLEFALSAIGVDVDLQEKPKAVKAKRKAGE